MREGKLGEGGAGVEGAGAGFDAADDEAVGGEVDAGAAERGAERASVNRNDAGGGARDAGAMGVARENEPGAGTVVLSEAAGEWVGGAPGGEDAKDAERGPHGVGGEAERVFHRVAFGLVALANLRGDGAPEGEAGVELPMLGAEGGGEEAADLGGIVAPGDDVVEEDVAVRDEDAAIDEVEGVLRGEIGVVVAGEERDRGVEGGQESSEVGAEFGGVGGKGAGARVDRVAVEDEGGGAGEEGADLGEVADAAGAVAVVKVGEDAGERGGQVEVKMER